MRRKGWVLVPVGGTLALLALAMVACVAQSRDFSGFDFRKDYYLGSGERRSGDQLILGYNINIEPGSAVEGSAVLIANKASLAGNMAGDVVVIADRLSLEDMAVVQGDLVVCAQHATISEYARIGGELQRECSEGKGVSVSHLIESGWSGWQDNAFVRLGSTIAGALLFGALAALGTLFFRRSLVRMSNSMRRAPAAAGGFGFLTILVAVGLTVVYLVSLLLVLPVILLPFVALGWLVIGLLSLLGWVALAEPFGNRLFALLGIDPQPAIVTAAAGGIALTLLVRMWGLFWFTSWIGLLLSVVLSSIGLGAVVLTRLGTRPFPRPERDPAVTRLAAD
jgi:hypothetical protein